jgi:hypothetical protein
MAPNALNVPAVSGSDADFSKKYEQYAPQFQLQKGIVGQTHAVQFSGSLLFHLRHGDTCSSLS